MSIIETDLNSKTSRTARRTTYEEEEIHKILVIPNSTIILPHFWSHHGIARLLMYVHNSMIIKQIPVERGNEDFSTISIEVGSEKSKKFILNTTYREHTGAVLGLKTIGSQQECLRRQIKHWENL